ncbi:uncharacterized protein LOC122852486 [Aphidius gifuensis]|nr:uncharacterized protein LOC122852486 [Aphidius gifuensis]
MSKVIDILKMFQREQPTFNHEIELVEDWSTHLLGQVDQLSNIPVVLKQDVSYMIQPCGQELVKFVKESYVNLQRTSSTSSLLYPTIYDYVEKVYWTQFGSIDKAKTFLNIYNDRKSTKQTVNNVYMFMEACKHCLEKPIEILWSECSNSEKRILLEKIPDVSYDDISDDFFTNEAVQTRHLLFYWRWYFNKKQSSVLQSPNNKNFQLNDRFDENSIFRDTIPKSIASHNFQAVKFFHDQLTPEKQQQIMTQTVNNLLTQTEGGNRQDNLDLLFFYIKKMTDQQIKNLIQKYGFPLLNNMIIAWPWRFLFPQLLEISWSFLTEDNYKNLVKNVVRKIYKEYEELGRKACTSVWLLIDFLEHNPEYLEEGAITFIWLLPLPDKMKLTAISFISAVFSTEKVIISKIRTEICYGLQKVGRALLTEGKYDMIDGFLKHFLNDNEKKPFIKSLDIEGNYKNLLSVADEEEEYRRIKKLINWQNNIGDTLASRLSDEIIKSDKQLEAKYNAYLEWNNNKENPSSGKVVKKENTVSFFKKISLPARNVFRG